MSHRAGVSPHHADASDGMPTMISVSTTWNSHKYDNAGPMIDEIRNMGITAVELSSRLSARQVAECVRYAQQRYITITSVHNFCPVPDGVSRPEASPDFYSLASLDPSMRREAVRYTRRSIDTAFFSGARAVVLHAGRLDIEDHTRELASLIADGKNPEECRNRMVAERAREADKGYLPALIESLTELLHHASARHIALGLENRFYYREIPSLDEFAILFRHFSHEPLLGYWHDTGHAQVWENIGICAHNDFLTRYGKRLIGIHLHDVTGVCEDHKAPRMGTVDFTLCAPYITPDTITVMEAHEPVTATQIREGADYLTSALHLKKTGSP